MYHLFSRVCVGAGLPLSNRNYYTVTVQQKTESKQHHLEKEKVIFQPPKNLIFSIKPLEPCGSTVVLKTLGLFSIQLTALKTWHSRKLRWQLREKKSNHLEDVYRLLKIRGIFQQSSCWFFGGEVPTGFAEKMMFTSKGRSSKIYQLGLKNFIMAGATLPPGNLPPAEIAGLPGLRETSGATLNKGRLLNPSGGKTCQGG